MFDASIWPFLFCIHIENFEGACTGQTFRQILEISNGRKTVRMAPILTIFGPNESQRCQLNFEKNLGRRKNFREGEKFEKVSRKVRNILSRTRLLGRNKIETFTWSFGKREACWADLHVQVLCIPCVCALAYAPMLRQKRKVA